MSGLPPMELGAQLRRLKGQAGTLNQRIRQANQDTTSLDSDRHQILEELARTIVGSREEVFKGDRDDADIEGIWVAIDRRYVINAEECGNLSLLQLYRNIVSFMNSNRSLPPEDLDPLLEYIAKVPAIRVEEILNVDFNDGSGVLQTPVPSN